MIKKALFTVITGMIISFGIAGSTWAEPDGSQLLRGLGDRTFSVQVTNLTGLGEPFGMFSNCYIFNEDGSWIDPLFPVPGTWIQHSTGASTSYSASALLDIGGGVGVLIEQQGTVTPAQGGGTLQLEADSHVSVILIADGSLLMQLDSFFSVGHQDNECSL
jgi:hypothetical protein